jgi:hypothetical protein
MSELASERAIEFTILTHFKKVRDLNANLWYAMMKFAGVKRNG